MTIFLEPSPGPVGPVRKWAAISEDARFRYVLGREWDYRLPPLLWVMLNPSIADSAVDDPTIRRCVGFARAWGYGSIRVVNLWAFRSTDAGMLKASIKHGEPVGDDHAADWEIRKAALESSAIIFAWGSHVQGPLMLRRARAVAEMLAHREPACLGYSKSGQPNHPLMLAAKTEREPFVWKAQS